VHDSQDRAARIGAGERQVSDGHSGDRGGGADREIIGELQVVLRAEQRVAAQTVAVAGVIRLGKRIVDDGCIGERGDDCRDRKQSELFHFLSSIRFTRKRRYEYETPKVGVSPGNIIPRKSWDSKLKSQIR